MRVIVVLECDEHGFDVADATFDGLGNITRSMLVHTTKSLDTANDLCTRLAWSTRSIAKTWPHAKEGP